MNKKVLITGGTGFIGRHVVDIMRHKGYELHLTSRNAPIASSSDVAFHDIDLMDTGQVGALMADERFDSVIHLAWYVGKGCHSSNENINWVSATLGLLQAFHENGGNAFLGAGTVSEYEYKYGYLVEDQTPTNPGTLYGESKNSVFKIASAFCKSNGIRFKWPRIFNLYGPDEKPSRLMPSVINSCLSNEPVLVSDCLKYQDYLYVKDMAEGIVRVYESDAEGPINICSGQPVQLRYIVNRIAELTDYRGEIVWGAIPAAFDNNVVVGDNDRLKSLGWTQRYSLDSGLQETIDWWRERRRNHV